MKCPKCGGWWIQHICGDKNCPFNGDAWCMECGHEEKVKR